METSSQKRIKEENSANGTRPENGLTTAEQTPTPEEEERTTQRRARQQSYD